MLPDWAGYQAIVLFASMPRPFGMQRPYPTKPAPHADAPDTIVVARDPRPTTCSSCPEPAIGKLRASLSNLKQQR